MASANGQCDLGFDKNSNVNTRNYSNPFILGQKFNVKLDQPEVPVEIDLTNSFNSNQKLADCDFIDDRDNDTPVGSDKSFTLSYYPNRRSKWVTGNGIPRTVNITYNNIDSIPNDVLAMDCSRDGGITFTASDCDSETSFTWDSADYNVFQHIRVTFRDGSVYEERFKPSDKHPNISFIDCDPPTITTDSHSDTTSLKDEIDNENGKVFCFEPGYNLTLTDTLYLGSSTFLTPQGALDGSDRAKFTTSSSAAITAQISYAGPSISATVMGVTVVASGTSPALNFSNDDALAANLNAIVEDIKVDYSGTGIAINTNSSSGLPANIVFRKANISSTDTNAYAVSTTTNGVVINLESSTVQSNNVALNSTAGVIMATENSNIVNQSVAYPTLKSSYDGNIVVENSKVKTDSTIALVNCGASSIATLELNGNTLIRSTANLGLGLQALVSANHDNATCINRIKSNFNDNKFCHLSTTAVPKFFGIIDTSFTGTFDPSLNGGNGPSTPCTN